VAKGDEGKKSDGSLYILPPSIEKKTKTNFLKVKIPESLLKASSHTTSGDPEASKDTQVGGEGRTNTKREKKSSENLMAGRIDLASRSDSEGPIEARLERTLNRFRNQRAYQGSGSTIGGAIRSRISELRQQVGPNSHGGSGSQTENVSKIQALLAKSKKMFGSQVPQTKEGLTPLQAIRSRLAQKHRETSASRGSTDQGPKASSMVYKPNSALWQGRQTSLNTFSAKKESPGTQGVLSGHNHLNSARGPGLIRSVYAVHRSVSKQSQGEEHPGNLGLRPQHFKPIEAILGEGRDRNFTKIRSLEAFLAVRQPNKLESDVKLKGGVTSVFKRPGFPVATSCKAVCIDRFLKRSPKSGHQTDRPSQPMETDTARELAETKCSNQTKLPASLCKLLQRPRSAS
jgi:hypothetical protein